MIKNKDTLKLLQLDVTPYELPLIYFNDNFSNYIDLQSNNTSRYYNLCPFGYKPYKFLVPKNKDECRILSLPHPASQLDFIKLLNDFNLELLDYFNQKNGFSLRRPCRQNSLNLRKGKLINTEFQKIFSVSIDEKSNEFYPYADSYFIKNSFNKITDFYSSNKFKDLESKFKFLRKIDIQKCFDSIYTHSIEWAFLGSKIEAKNTQNIKTKLGSRIDAVMQTSNFKETSGILVGPEISRMVAEIILCKVDESIKSNLSKTSLKTFEIFRFVDDIFIFSNSETELDYIENLYTNELQEFKLNLNLSKKMTLSAPFCEGLLWKGEVKNLLKNYIDTFECENEKDDKKDSQWIKRKKIQNKNDIIFDSLRSILIKHKDSQNFIVSYIITYLESNSNIFLETNLKSNEFLEVHLVRFLDFISYFFSFNMTYSNTLKIIKVYTKLLVNFKETLPGLEEFIFKKNYKFIKYHLTNKNFVDLQNIIIFLSYFNKDLPEEILLNILSETPSLDYFKISTISFYVSRPTRLYRFKRTKALLNKIINNTFSEFLLKYNLQNFDINSSKNKCKDFEKSICDFDFLIFCDFYKSPISSKIFKENFSIIINQLTQNLKSCKDSYSPTTFVFAKFATSIDTLDYIFINWDATLENITLKNIFKTSKTSFGYLS